MTMLRCQYLLPVALFIAGIAAVVDSAAAGGSIASSVAAAAPSYDPVPESPRITVGAFGARIYLGTSGDGWDKKPLPVVLFVTGFGGLTPSGFYGHLLNKLASEGFIVVGLDRFKTINYPNAAKDFLDVMAWVQSGGLQNAMDTYKIGASPDLSRVAVMAQSSGNHVVGQALADNCTGVAAFVMIDPVDGVDPYGIVKNQDLIVPGKPVNFTLPSLILRTGLDPVAENPAFPPCAPAELSNDRFFFAMRGPVWMVNATAYGHIDCMDHTGFPADLVCPTNSSTDKTLYKDMLADAASTFLGAMFGTRSKDDLARLEAPGSFNVSVILQQDLKGLSHAEIRPGCANSAHASFLVV